MAFLGLGFSTRLCNAPKNVMNASWTYCKVVRKYFGSIFLFRGMFQYKCGDDLASQST